MSGPDCGERCADAVLYYLTIFGISFVAGYLIAPAGFWGGFLLGLGICVGVPFIHAWREVRRLPPIDWRAHHEEFRRLNETRLYDSTRWNAPMNRERQQRG